MHERALVQSLIEQVRSELRERGLGRLHGVRLQIGEFAGVEPALVDLAFAELAAQSFESDVRLEVETVPLCAVCAACHEAFRVAAFRFVCPQCGSGDVRVVSGEELRIVSLQAERSAACAGAAP